MEKFWKSAIALTGLGGVAAFVFWSLYKNWLTLPIFAQLNSEQTFYLMLTFVVLTFASLIGLLITYVVTKRHHGEGNVAVPPAVSDSERVAGFTDAFNEIWRRLPHGSLAAVGLDRSGQDKVLSRLRTRVRREGEERGCSFNIIDIDLCRVSEDEFLEEFRKQLRTTKVSVVLNKESRSSNFALNSDPLDIFYFEDFLEEVDRLSAKDDCHYQVVLVLVGTDESLFSYSTKIPSQLRSLTQKTKHFSIVVMAETRNGWEASALGYRSSGASPLGNIMALVDFDSQKHSRQ